MSNPRESATELRARLASEQRKLQAVRELGKAFGADLELDHLLTTLVHKVPELLDAERATLYLLLDTEPGVLVSRAVYGLGGATGPSGPPIPPVVQQIRLRIGEGIAGTVAETKKPLNIPNAYDDPRFNPEVDRRTGFVTRSILCVPIPDHEGRVTGVLQALNRRGGPFDADDEALLATVAAYAGVALENSKLYQSLRTHNEQLRRTQRDLQQRISELNLLFQIEKESAAAMDLPELIERLSRRAIELCGAEAGLVGLRLPSGELEVIGFRVSTDGEPRKVRLSPNEGLLPWVVQRRRSTCLGVVSQGGGASGREPSALFLLGKSGEPPLDPLLHIRDILGLSEIRQVLAVPLDHPEAHGVDGVESDEAIGALAVVNKTPATVPFSVEDMKLLSLISGHAARAIMLSRTRALRTREGHLAGIGRMLAGVMHDLRTPLTIVSGYAQMMATSDNQAERERYAALINKQFELLKAMTGEVLAFARGDSVLFIRRVLLSRFVEELKEQVEQELPQGVKLVFEAEYLGPAHFDELKLLRLSHNLVRNAVEAMPGGGTLRISIKQNDKEILFVFADTGEGMPEEIRDHLFESFATLGKEGGTGLGLAIVKKIVDDHHGRISVSSRRGHGTTFTVALPLFRE